MYILMILKSVRVAECKCKGPHRPLEEEWRGSVRFLLTKALQRSTLALKVGLYVEK